MRLIAISLPEFHSDEARQITRLLADGAFWRVHLRKPGAKPDDLRRLLDSVPAELYPRLSLHDFFDIAEERSLGGVHLNSRNPDAPAGWTGMTSRSCHSTAELKEHAGLDYLFLSPVFDSISKPGYHSAFSLDSLHASGLLGPNIFALGGVTPERLPALADAGFGGAAMLGAAWNFPEEKNQDEKQKNMLQFITHTIEGLDDVLRGGCRWVQLRMKDASDEEFIATALRTSEICRRYNATFIVDDRIHLAPYWATT